jgi:hypothetical protein
MFEIKMFLKKINKFKSQDCNQVDRLLMSFLIFRWYIVKKISREENFVFIVRVNITSNLENFVAFSNEDVQIMLRDAFIFFNIHDFKNFLLLKIVDFTTIRRRRENCFKKLSNFDCFRFLHLTQKFDSSTFFIQLIKLTLQNSVIRFECFDNWRVKRIEYFVHRN